MKSKLSGIGIFVLTLALVSPWPAGAQEPRPPQMVPYVVPAAPSFQPEKGIPFRSSERPRPQMDTAIEGLEASAATFSLGQPGLSFRYAQTFGVTEQPYPASTSHLNGPSGLFIGSANQLYVTEWNGNRMLRFTASGANNMVLGHAGLGWHHDDYLARPTDVATDGSGNIWVVSNPMVKKFSPSGTPLLTIPENNPWDSGSDNYHFDNPWAIAFDSLGRLFVSDTGNNRIQIYNVVTTPVYVLTISGFNQPQRIAFDSLGRLYVVDAGNQRVQRCVKSLVPTETWTCSTFFGVTGVPGNDLTHLGDYARGIAVQGSNVFIADGTNYRVLKCNLSGVCSHFAGVNGERGWDNARFWWPEDVAVDSLGNVYVSDWDNHRVQVFTPSGAYLRTVGVTRVPYVPDTIRLNAPWGLAIAPDGSLYVAENRGHRLVKLNADGVQQWAVGQAGVYGSDNAHLSDLGGHPAVDAAGRVYVADTANHRIQIFNSDGSYYATFGSLGDGNYEFVCPVSVAISPANGDIFVVDQCNQRIQVYSSLFVYKTTLGVLDETGSDNAHFNWPWGVAVDASGNVYVADRDNFRVQKCVPSGTSYTCSTFAGQTGVFSNSFAHLLPLDVAVDGAGRVYVVDEWNARIQVFDSNGAYLTTIGGAWGPNTGQLRGPSGVAVDAEGNVYVADRDNHRIQKFSPGVPGWKQVNLNGFGQESNYAVSTLDVFNGQMYAGTWSAQVWRTPDGQTWNQVTPSGWPTSTTVMDAQVFDGRLYVATASDNGGEIWRTDGLNWTQVVTAGFGITNNYGINALAVFGGAIYAATSAADGVMQVYRSATGDAGAWTAVVSDGFGGGGVWQDVTMDVYNGQLYLGLGRNGTAELWRSGDGVNWTAVFLNGLASGNSMVSAMAEFNGAFYIGLHNETSGGQVWRSTNGLAWTQVVAGGLGNPSNRRPHGLIVFNNRLYLVFSNLETGVEVWRSADGTSWEKVLGGGWGDSNNIFGSYFDRGAVVFNNRLFIGASKDANDSNSGQVWQKTVTADFAASPRVGPPGTVVTFTNLAGGDVLNATWNFGDGSPALTVNHTGTVTHIYATPGVYTVTLTVQDNVDSATRQRARYINIAHRAFLPGVMRNYDPLIALYDDFNNPAFNGFYDPIKWRFWGDGNYFSARQMGGTLVITNTPSTPAIGIALPLGVPLERNLRQLQRFQARLRLSSGTVNTSAKIHISGYMPGMGSWWTECVLSADNGNPPQFGCSIINDSTAEYGTGWPSSLNFNTWYTARIDINPGTARICFYLNSIQLGCHIPSQANALKTANNLIPMLVSWNHQAGATGIRYFDDVQITPAWP